MTNILVIRTHRLGDILQLIPMFHGLKMQYPDSKIYFLTDENYVPLIAANKAIDAVIPLDEKKCRYILTEKNDQYYRLFNDFYDLINQLREIKFDLIINRQYEFGAILAYLIGASRIYGGAFSHEHGYFFADRSTEELFNLIRSDRRKNRRNLTDWACRIAGIEKTFPQKICFPISISSLHEANTLITTKFGDADDIIAVQMGAAQSFRQWGTGNFLPVLQWLTKKGKKIILTGNDDEKEDAATISQNLRDGSCLNLAGATSLPVLAAVITQCKLLLTPDTGTMHIASAVGTPALALFYGGAYPWETGPYGTGHFILWPDLDCAPCSDPLSCPYNHRCKRELTPDIVINALEAINKSRKSGEINWPSSGKIKLLMTQTENYEQDLVTAANKTTLPADYFKSLFSLEVSEITPDILLAQCQEIAGLLQEAEPEKYFVDASIFFSNFSLYLAHTDGENFAPQWRNLHAQITKAIMNKDIVLLYDFLRYKIAPVLKSSF